MDKKKLLKMIKVFFVFFIISGVGTIIDCYFSIFPQMFAKPLIMYEIFRLNQVSIKTPGVPFILTLLTITIYVCIIRRIFKSIITEIEKAN